MRSLPTNRPRVEPMPDVPLPEFPQSQLLPEGCEVVEGWEDDDTYQVEYREAIYVTRTLADGTPCPRKLYVLVPSTKDPIKASYGAGGYPCVVFCQGSAFHTQHIYGHFADHVRLASHGFVVAGVQYRESDLAPFPAQEQDVKTAVRYLRAHADAYHLDPQRIGLWGDSSGGHTVLMAGFTAGMDAPRVRAEGQVIELDTPEYADFGAEVSCIVDWYGPTRFDEMNCAPSAQDHDAPASPEGCELGSVCVTEHSGLCEAASPLHYVPQVSERVLPPLLIMHGGRDQLVNFEQSCFLYERMREAGQRVRFVKLPDANHGSAGFRCEAALDMVEEFLREHLSSAADTVSEGK